MHDEVEAFVVGVVVVKLVGERGLVKAMRMVCARLVDLRVRMAMVKVKTWLSAGRARSCAFVGLRRMRLLLVLEMVQAHLG